LKQSKFKVVTEVLRSMLNVSTAFYGLSKIRTFIKRVERLYSSYVQPKRLTEPKLCHLDQGRALNDILMRAAH